MFLANILPTDSVAQAHKEEITGLIKSGRYEELFDRMLHTSIDFVLKVAFALLLFFVGRWLIRRINRVVNTFMEKRKVDTALKGFLSNLVSIFLFMVLIIIIINVIGTQTFSIAALIGSAGLAIGLAVKDNLANFAGGVMLLLNKPFKIGDWIEAQGMSGKVQSIGILYSTLTTGDNKTINIPNGPLSTGNIVNIATQPTRRVSMIIPLEYGTDVDAAKEFLLEIGKAHPLVHETPAPACRMVNMGDHSIDFRLRVWTDNSNFWTVTHDLNEEIYRQINAKGFVIPFNQLSVHIEK